MPVAALDPVAGELRLKSYPVIVLFLALGVGGYFAYDAWRIEVTFESVPAGALVRIDGTSIGLTPISGALDPGRHRVEFTHSHYLPETIQLDVSRGQRLSQRTIMRQGMGGLKLLSNPRGAWVEVDGKRQVGVTPMEVDSPTGPTHIRMGLSERRVAEKEVIVLADEVLEINLPLDMDPHGSLIVLVSPADAKVRFPALELDYEENVRVPIGEHLIEVSRSGYETQVVRFQIRYGDNQTEIDLPRSVGVLRVRTTPASAAVSITYENAPGLHETVSFETGMRLPVGVLEVSARAMGYRTEFRTLNLTPAGAEVSLDLTRITVTPGETLRDQLAGGGSGPEMIVIPPGRFVMGDPEGPPSMQPARTRTLSQPFSVSKYEVTVEEFLSFARATDLKPDERLVDPREPARYVAWAEAKAYADWLTEQTGAKYRLPTEAEWEYVARAGTDTDYWFGDEIERLCEFANLADLATKKVYRSWAVLACDDGYGQLAPVGSYPANPFGLHDVHGNVTEWVLECGIPPYSRAAEDGAEVNTGQSCNTHGVRGGSWDSQPEALRSRRRGYARYRGDDRGIRLLREL